MPPTTPVGTHPGIHPDDIPLVLRDIDGEPSIGIDPDIATPEAMERLRRAARGIARSGPGEPVITLDVREAHRTIRWSHPDGPEKDVLERVEPTCTVLLAEREVDAVVAQFPHGFPGGIVTVCKDGFEIDASFLLKRDGRGFYLQGDVFGVRYSLPHPGQRYGFAIRSLVKEDAAPPKPKDRYSHNPKELQEQIRIDTGLNDPVDQAKYLIEGFYYARAAGSSIISMEQLERAMTLLDARNDELRPFLQVNNPPARIIHFPEIVCAWLENPPGPEGLLHRMVYAKETARLAHEWLNWKWIGKEMPTTEPAPPVEFHSTPASDWREFVLGMWALVEKLEPRHDWILSSEILAVAAEVRRLLEKYAWQYGPPGARPKRIEIADQQTADAVAQQKLDELRAKRQSYMRISDGPWLRKVKVAPGVSRWDVVTDLAELARLEKLTGAPRHGEAPQPTTIAWRCRPGWVLCGACKELQPWSDPAHETQVCRKCGAEMEGTQLPTTFAGTLL